MPLAITFLLQDMMFIFDIYKRIVSKITDNMLFDYGKILAIS